MDEIHKITELIEELLEFICSKISALEIHFLEVHQHSTSGLSPQLNQNQVSNIDSDSLNREALALHIGSSLHPSFKPSPTLISNPNVKSSINEKWTEESEDGSMKQVTDSMKQVANDLAEDYLEDLATEDIEEKIQKKDKKNKDNSTED